MNAWNRPGLCAACRHVRITGNRRGSAFYLCTRSQWDPSFRRYPPLPVLACRGFEPQTGGDPTPAPENVPEPE